MSRLPSHLILVGGLVAFGFASGQETPGERARRSAGGVLPAEGAAFFEKKIRPVLVAECYGCHSAGKGKKVRGGLALDTREGTRKGGDSGPVIVPGSPSRSRLIKALGHGDPKLAMPPKKKLDETVVRDFEEWVRMGAPDPRGGATVARKDQGVEKGRSHWAYQPPRRVAVPRVKDAAWPRTDVDRFVLAALETKGLTPVGDAGRPTRSAASAST
jgi:hypothetical protein